MIIKILEYVRIAGVCLAFFVGYLVGFSGSSYDPLAQLHIMIPLIIIAMAGTSGVEGLLFREQTAKAKGYETGSNYQIQSAVALLSYTFGALLVFVLNWGIRAELAILFTFLFFFIFSAINHLRSAIVDKNYKFANINRPFLVLIRVIGLFYPVIMAIDTL
jgi:hypothetical protein